MKLRRRKTDKSVSLDETIDTGEDTVTREIAAWDENPEQQFSREELGGILDTAIQSLEPPYRSVFVLRDIEELSTEETARILELNNAVVKTRLHRGRAAMREKLDCYLNNHCLEDQVCPSPAPLTPAEREQLYGAWRSSVA